MSDRRPSATNSFAESGGFDDAPSGGTDSGDGDSGDSGSSSSSGGRRTNIGSGSTGGRGSVDRTDPSSVPSSGGSSSGGSSSGSRTRTERTTERIPSATASFAEAGGFEGAPSGGTDAGGGRGTIADARIPGTDSTVLDVADRADSAFQDRVVEPAAGLGRDAGEADLPVGPGGAVEGSEQRGQLGADFGRSAAQAVNVPGFVAGALRAGPEIAQTQGDPERARRGVEAGAELGGEAAGFARDNPLRAGAMFAGTLAGAGAATGAARATRTGAQRAREAELPDAPAPSLAADTRGQTTLGRTRRSRDGDDSGSSLMDELQADLDRMETGTAIRRGRDRAEERITQRRLEEGRRQERGDEPQTVSRPESTTVSRPESTSVSRGLSPEETGPSTGTQPSGFSRGLDTDLSPRESQLAAQLGRETPDVDFRAVDRLRRETPDTDLRIAADQVPRDPLDTRGGVLGGTAEQTGLGVATGQSVGGLLGQASEGDSVGALFEPTAGQGSDIGLTPDDVGIGTEPTGTTTTGTGTDTTPTSGTDTATDVAPMVDVAERARTGAQSRQAARGGQRTVGGPGGADPFAGLRDTFGDPDLGSPGRPGRPTGTPPRGGRTGRPPRIGASEGEDEFLEIDSEFDDALIDSGIADAEDLLNSDDSAFRF